MLMKNNFEQIYHPIDDLFQLPYVNLWRANLTWTSHCTWHNSQKCQ